MGKRLGVTMLKSFLNALNTHFSDIGSLAISPHPMQYQARTKEEYQIKDRVELVRAQKKISTSIARIKSENSYGDDIQILQYLVPAKSGGNIIEKDMLRFIEHGLV